MPQTEPRRDASFLPVQFIQEHKQLSVCAHIRYAFLMKYNSRLAIVDTAKEMEHIGLRGSWVTRLVSVIAEGKWNIVVSTAPTHRVD